MRLETANLEARIEIIIRIEHDYSALLGLASILESNFPVRFVFSKERRGNAAAEIFSVSAKDTSFNCKRSGIPSFAAPLLEDVPGEGPLPYEIVNFKNHSDVPFPFRGRELRARVKVRPEILRLNGTAQPLATT